MQGSAQVSHQGLLGEGNAEEVEVLRRNTAKSAPLAMHTDRLRLSLSLASEFREFRMRALGRAGLDQVPARNLGTHAQFCREQARLRGAGRVEADAEHEFGTLSTRRYRRGLVG